jgi:tetratricopeptide (TPR) repeat protein
MKWVALILMLLTTMAHADRIENLAELARLPAYCRGTQQIREISQEPSYKVQEYYAKYGPTYNHLHHYCWALNTENRVSIQNPRDGKFWLGTAIGDIDYVLHQNHDPKFILLPEIYTSKARILFKIDQAADAIPWLQKAIATRPDYVPAYARLSDYYAERGDTAEAIKILKQGIAKSKKADMLNRRLGELQKQGGGKSESSPSR